MVCEYLCDFCTNGITFVRLQLCLLGMNHLQSAAPCRENGSRPAEDPVPTEGSRKSCQAEKSGEKMDDNVSSQFPKLKWGFFARPSCQKSIYLRLATRSMTMPRLQRLVSSPSAPFASENIFPFFMKMNWTDTLQDCDAGPQDIQAAFWKQTLQTTDARGTERHQDIVSIFPRVFCQAMQQCVTHLMSCFWDILWRDMS